MQKVYCLGVGVAIVLAVPVVSWSAQRGSTQIPRNTEDKALRGGEDSLLMPGNGNVTTVPDSVLERALTTTTVPPPTTRPGVKVVRHENKYIIYQLHQQSDLKLRRPTESTEAEQSPRSPQPLLSRQDSQSSEIDNDPESPSPTKKLSKLERMREMEALDLEALRGKHKSDAELTNMFLVSFLGDEDSPRSRAFYSLSEPVRLKIVDIYKSCAPDEVRSIRVSYVGRNGVTEKYSGLSRGFKLGKDAIRAVAKLPGKIATATRKLSMSKDCFEQDPQQERYRKTPALSILDDMLLEKAEGMSSEQAACLAMCAASNSFKYGFWSFLASPFKTGEKTLKSETGVCWDYTRLSNHFLKVLKEDRNKSGKKDLFFRTRSNTPHSFLEVRFKESDPWFGAEPTPSIDPPVQWGKCSLIDYRLKRAAPTLRERIKRKFGKQ